MAIAAKEIYVSKMLRVVSKYSIEILFVSGVSEDKGNFLEIVVTRKRLFYF